MNPVLRKLLATIAILMTLVATQLEWPYWASPMFAVIALVLVFLPDSKSSKRQ